MNGHGIADDHIHLAVPQISQQLVTSVRTYLKEVKYVFFIGIEPLETEGQPR
jgi:hypothetical protein